MQEKYKRTEIVITAFDQEAVITTSGVLPDDPINPTPERHINVDYGTEVPHSWW